MNNNKQRNDNVPKILFKMGTTYWRQHTTLNKREFLGFLGWHSHRWTVILCALFVVSKQVYNYLSSFTCQGHRSWHWECPENIHSSSQDGVRRNGQKATVSYEWISKCCPRVYNTSITWDMPKSTLKALFQVYWIVILGHGTSMCVLTHFPGSYDAHSNWRTFVIKEAISLGQITNSTFDSYLPVF